ncbi:MAG: hypothetical protein GXP49_05425, partial [Deltaproteobacteria bacterium]|nr:hypothetical protein [Deltaproteobacteria bacterium]
MNKFGLFLLVVMQATVAMFLGGCDCGGGNNGCKLDSDCSNGQVCDVNTGKCKPAELVPGIKIKDLDPNKVNILEQDKDDTDTSTEGFQFTLVADATNIESGQQAKLCKLVDDGQGGKKEKDCVTQGLVKDGNRIFVTFTDYTLDFGLQTLRVTASNKSGKEAQDQVEVRALAPNACAVTIQAPANHATLTSDDDKNNERPDLQYDVVASAINVEAGNTCTLTAGDRPAVQAQPQGTTVTFQDADLPISRQPDSLKLTVECTNNVGNTCSDSVTIAVDLPDCQVTITPPSGTFNASDDEDADTDGLQKTVTVTSDECPDGTDVVLTVNGADEPTAQLSNHTAKFTITLPDDIDRNPAGPSQVEANLSSPDNRTGHDLVQYSVDTVPPVAAITDPPDGAVLGKADDYNPATADILEHDVVGTVSNGDKGTVISLFLDQAQDPVETYTMSSDDVSNDPFQFRFRVVPFDEGTHVLKVTAQDPAGNQGEAENSLTVSMAEPGVHITDPMQSGTDPAVLGCGDDLNDQVDSLQYLVCADTANVPKGPNSTLSIDNGEPIPGTVDDTGKTCFMVALGDGEHQLVACVQVQGFDEVCSDPVTVDVDWTPPVITFDYYGDGMPINTPVFDLAGGVAGAADGTDVVLTVDTNDPVKTTLAEGGFTFKNVTLTGEGDHNLTVSVKLDNGCEASKTIKLTLDVTPPSLGMFLKPADGNERAADGAALVEADDLDSDCSDGFQSNVVVHVQGVPAGTEVRLWLNSATPVTANTDDSGTVLFDNVFLKEGSNLMTARATDIAGNEGMANASFTANCGCPVATVTPGAGEYVTTDDDVDPNTDGVQADIHVDSDAGPNVIFKLYINEGMGLPCQLNEQVQTSDSNGDATFPAVPLCQGENTIRITSDDAGKVCTIAMHSVTVKLGKPSIQFANLADGQYLNLSNEDSSPGAPGFQYDVQFTTLEAEDGSIATLTVNGTDVYTATVASGAGTFKDVKLCDQAACENTDTVLEAKVKDLADQESDPAQLTVHVDRVAPVVEITKPNKDLLGNADDE